MTKTNSGLIEYCKAQLGLPYWYGTFGQKASASLYEAKKKQYPKYYTAKDFQSQYGQRVHDCAGLIKGYLWSDTPTSTPKYDSKTDFGATAFYQHCTKKGTIDTFDHVPGRLVFKGKPSKMTHVGVYVGDGEIIEAKGHAYGVVKTKLDSKWTHWGQCDLIREDNEVATSQPIAEIPEAPIMSIEELAREVIAGKWGDNPARKQKLIEAGYDYAAVQAEVNRILKGGLSSESYKVRTNGNPLALRVAPSTQSALITYMKNGSTIKVTGDQGNWSRVTFAGITGWAYSKWITKY